MLLSVAAALCAPAAATGAQDVVSGEFVGAIPNSDPKDGPGGPADELVAVAVYDPAPSGVRQIRVYICDGDAMSPEGDAEWFAGRIRGDSFRLRSADRDARVTGRLTERAATGVIRLPDRRVLRFRAAPAAAGGGLYEIAFLTDGTYFGTSAGGSTITGRVTEETFAGPVGTRRVRAQARTLSGFRTRPFDIVTRFSGAAVPPGSQPSTVVLLPRAAGIAGRTRQIKQTGGTTTEFYDWILY